jgi:hypothetical protein
VPSVRPRSNNHVIRIFHEARTPEESCRNLQVQLRICAEASI